ncbi:MAG: DUF421 domain-containing protein [Chloroflexota bacterium]|nr:DUF421 domain-containing protein [Chloroflexota bacterium]
MDLALFKGWNSVFAAAVETFAFYLYALVLLRVAGKRTIAKITVFDFVSTVAMASIIAGTVISASVPLADGMAALTVLVALQWLVAFAASRSDRFARLITNTPRVLFTDSRYLDSNLRDERIARSEVVSKAREAGHASMDTVNTVVLESTGDFSVLETPADGTGEGEQSTLRRVKL